MLNIGEQAPDFDLVDQNGETIKLSKIDTKYVVLYFYPKDLTPGCTIETCSFRDFNEEMKDAGVTVLGIGRGDEKSKTKFSEKHDVNFPLLIDEDSKIASEYGAYVEKSMFGKKYMGISRVTYLINEKMEIVFVWEKVKPLNHAEAVLDKVRTLG